MNNFMHMVHNRPRRNVVLAPHDSRHDSALFVDAHDMGVITPGAFHGCNVKSENVALLASALYMI